MRARILKPCTVVCGPDSIVEVTQDQFLALGDAAVEAEVSSLDTTPKKAASAKKATTTKKG